MKRTTEQVLKEEIAAAQRLLEKAETAMDKANEAWALAAGDVSRMTDQLAGAMARRDRAIKALEAFTPVEELPLPFLIQAELESVSADELPVEGEIS